MSTVLWANVLVNGEVGSNESDMYALYKHSRKLDKITKQLKVTSFISIQDFTDAQFNLSDDDLPDGMESTDELMAARGVWVAGADAVEMLENLISHISSQKIKFGFFKNDSEEILAELGDSLEWAKKAKDAKGMFNFSVIM